jgi:osmoprotectant transport system permease protein
MKSPLALFESAACRLTGFALASTLMASQAPADELVIGSKRFTESYILGEIATQSVRAAGGQAVHRQGLGNTAILFEALKAGSIHLYPDYTGTIARELLKIEATDLDTLNRGLRPLGLGVAVKLGFNNTYALALLESKAQALGAGTIGDLARHPDLRFGLSHEFLERSDGWPGLKRIYGLPHSPRGLDHGLAYEAIAAGRIDAMDIYSTDAKIAKYALRVMEDDKRYFPEYAAAFVYRLEVPERFPRAWAALARLEERIDEQAMIAMNAKAELDGVAFATVAGDFLAAQGAVPAKPSERTWLALLFGPDFWRLTAQHLMLVFVSLAAAVLVGVPLGMLAARQPASAQPILGGVSVVQTVPSLALLAFLIPVLGMIGTVPALVALFLYSLLPIVRNTHSGLNDIPPHLHESARALGLPAGARLRIVELPLAARSILSGIKTSAVINVGTATIAAFIGAGGYGERIVTGLALNDNGVLLAGAVPAAALALMVQVLFDALDRWLISPGLR